MHEILLAIALLIAATILGGCATKYEFTERECVVSKYFSDDRQIIDVQCSRSTRVR